MKCDVQQKMFASLHVSHDGGGVLVGSPKLPRQGGVTARDISRFALFRMEVDFFMPRIGFGISLER